MDEEIKALLRQNLEVSEKSLAILKKMRQEVIMGRIFQFIKWVIIIGLIVFSFVKIQPYLIYWGDVFSSISENMDKFSNFFGR